jgi:drug/metabolite transporter (DMT)-like permease
LPSLKDDFPKPTLWDLAALAMLAVGGVAMAANLLAAKSTGPGSALSGTQTSLFVTTGLAVCIGCLLLLGKTSKEGTIWGNLAAIGGMFVGVSAVLLAAALWAAA